MLIARLPILVAALCVSFLSSSAAYADEKSDMLRLDVIQSVSDRDNEEGQRRNTG